MSKDLLLEILFMTFVMYVMIEPSGCLNLNQELTAPTPILVLIEEQRVVTGLGLMRDKFIYDLKINYIELIRIIYN